MRPSTFTPELGDDICRRLAAGESARQICRDEGMPAMSTLMKWLNDSDKVQFSEQYARALMLFTKAKFLLFKGVRI